MENKKLIRLGRFIGYWNAANMLISFPNDKSNKFDYLKVGDFLIIKGCNEYHNIRKYRPDLLYMKGDIVYELGKFYECLASHTSHYEKVKDNLTWKEIGIINYRPRLYPNGKDKQIEIETSFISNGDAYVWSGTAWVLVSVDDENKAYIVNKIVSCNLSVVPSEENLDYMKKDFCNRLMNHIRNTTESIRSFVTVMDEFVNNEIEERRGTIDNNHYPKIGAAEDKEFIMLAQNDANNFEFIRWLYEFYYLGLSDFIDIITKYQ